ncbi:MAG: hypothetical protein OEV42_14510 [Deltaproteobacteria bacterium]|nr:hypothetical protein [Deltaproteobacteria bacterium]
MGKAINIIIIFCLFVFLTGFKQTGGSTSGHGGMGEIAAHDGIVVEVIALEGYTYVELDLKSEKMWIAAPAFKVKKGDRVLASKGIEMRNYYSRYLDRTFPVVWFVGKVEVVGKDEVVARPADAAENKKVASIKSPLIGTIKKAEGGYFLDELFEKKKELAGKKIKIRAKIVKASGSILGKEWYHVQDGTGSDAVLDLIITSKDKVEAGRIVLITGTLGVDRDFGSGYRYDIIVEDAELIVE